MKILVDIGHPAHVHLFKNFARKMQDSGNVIYFTTRDKEFVQELLENEGIPYIKIGRHFKSVTGKIRGLFIYNIKLLWIGLKYKPDFFLSHGSIYTLLSSCLLRIPNIALEDTGNKEQVNIYKPFTKAIITSSSFLFNYGKKQIFYNGFHELAYLHPNYFTPDYSVKTELGIRDKDRYFIVRFVSWKASHDIRNRGLTFEQKRDVIRILSQYGRVFISSEDELPDDLSEFKFPLSPCRMHHALAFTDLFVGEGATMASECAILGTSAIYINPLEAGSINELEKYGLMHHFRDTNGIIDKIRELLETPFLKQKSIEKSKEIIRDKIDLTEFLFRLFINWPESVKILMEQNAINRNLHK